MVGSKLNSGGVPRLEIEVGSLQRVGQGGGLRRIGLWIEDLVQVHAPGALDLAHARLEGELQVPLRSLAVQARGHPHAGVRPRMAVEQVEDGAAQDQRVAPRSAGRPGARPRAAW